MRKGISFTMTLIIVAVVLLVASITVLSLFGSGMNNFFGVLSQSTTSSSVEQKCMQVRRELQQKVCEAYTTADYDSYRYSYTPDTGHTQTCIEAECSFQFSGDDTWSYRVFDPTESQDYDLRQIDLTVTVEGNTYNCYEQGHLPQTCPAQ